MRYRNDYVETTQHQEREQKREREVFRGILIGVAILLVLGFALKIWG